MWLLASAFDLDTSAGWLQFLLLLASMFGGWFAYGLRGKRLRSILSEPGLTDGLTAEQRLRLELGLVDTAPEYDDTDPANPLLIDDKREIAGAVREAREQSRRREHGHLDDLPPGELARLRRRMDHLLRARWADLEALLEKLRLDHTGESWAALIAGDFGAMALLYDLAAEVRAAKQQPTFPTVALQLEGPLQTLHGVLNQALEAVDPQTKPDVAQRLQGTVLDFLKRVLPGISENIHETETKGERDAELDSAYECELASQDLPTV